MVTRVSNAAAIASVNAVTALLDAGAGPGYIEIRTGAIPADVSQAATGTLLGTLPLSATAFAAATDAVGKASAAAGAITQDASADAAGTAGWFRAYDGDGVAVIDGDVSTSGAALNLNNINIALNDTLDISSWLFEQSET